MNLIVPIHHKEIESPCKVQVLRRLLGMDMNL